MVSVSESRVSEAVRAVKASSDLRDMRASASADRRGLRVIPRFFAGVCCLLACSAVSDGFVLTPRCAAPLPASAVRRDPPHGAIAVAARASDGAGSSDLVRRRQVLAAWAGAGVAVAARVPAAAAEGPGPRTPVDPFAQPSIESFDPPETTFLRSRLDDSSVQQRGKALPFSPNQLYYPAWAFGEYAVTSTLRQKTFPRGAKAAPSGLQRGGSFRCRCRHDLKSRMCTQEHASKEACCALECSQ